MTTFNVSTINKQAFVSVLTATLHNNGQSPVEALVIASAMMSSLDKLGMVPIEKWVKNVTKYIERDARIEVGDEVATGFSIPNWFDTLVHANLMTREGDVGMRLVEMVLETEKSYPAYASHGVTRRNPIMPRNSKHKLANMVSPLTQSAVNVLESTQYTVDEWMLDLIIAVTKDEVCDEQYVIDGCLKLVRDGNGARVSEFKADRRVRLYQADCHGPNGQASDTERALMDLHGVRTDYDIAKVIPVLRNEMADMVCVDLQEAIDHLRSQESLVTYVKEQRALRAADKADQLPKELEKDLKTTKVMSFVKANRILAMLEQGKRPYIGMAFGLDAKCSGPQYGAIMTGDIELAKACGFGTEKARRDAYEIAIDICEGQGIHGLSRSLIKKPYMGIFYGQGAGAFSDYTNYGAKPSQHDPRLLPVIEGIEAQPGEDETLIQAQAKKFHAAIESSFGLMKHLREAIKNAHYHYEDMDGFKVRVFDTTEPTMHMMPDNSFIAMDYKVKVDILGRKLEYGVEIPDVIVEVSGAAEKFEKMTFNTSEYNMEDYARSGFVNLIQGTDALIARHIIAACGELDVQHTIAVHDCFRVNINDFIEGKLHEAIEIAYMRVFNDMQKGSGDILGKYFEGVRNAGGNKPTRQICFMLDADGDLKMGDWLDVEGIIKSLGNEVTGKQGAYYFAK